MAGGAAAPGTPAPSFVAPRKEWEPGYLKLARSKELGKRARELRAIYESCHLCPRRCGANRRRGQTGMCRSTAQAKVYTFDRRFAEERPLTGWKGSGCIFFSHCNLLCTFCQNWEINHRGDGEPVSDRDLAGILMQVQEMGCHCVDLVTPTHILPNIVRAVEIAADRGFRLPLVHNCGGYEGIEAIRLLDGIVDIYLPDYKYFDGGVAASLSAGAADYPERAAEAIKEMHRQVGDLVADEDGLGLRGVIVRHLIMPDNLGGTDKFVRWVAKELTPYTLVNLMGQYRPAYQAERHPSLKRRISLSEYLRAVDLAREAGLKRLYTTEWRLREEKAAGL
jgi:putative pyruvate formate lyase activating enzyme